MIESGTGVRRRLRRTARWAWAGERQLDRAAGCRLTVVAVVPLVVATAVDRLDVGILVTVAALNVGLSDPGGSYRIRMTTTLAASAVMTVALVLATLVGGSVVFGVFALAGWVFVMAFVADLNAAAAGVAFVGTAIFLIGLGLPDDPQQVWFRAGWFLVGCGWAVLVTASLWRVRRDAPARSALATAFALMADFLRESPHSADDRSARRDQIAAAVDSARAAVADRVRSRGDDSRLLVATVGVADGIEAGLGAVDAALASMEEVPLAITDAVHSLADICADISRATLDRGAWNTATLGAARRRLDSVTLDAESVIVRDVVELMATDLTTEESRREHDVARRRRPLMDTVTRLASRLHRSSTVFRHALRTAVVVAMAQTVASFDPFAKSYWIPLTVVVILRPNFGSTIERSAQRVVGTMGGVLVAFVVTSQLDGRIWALVVVFTALIFVLGASFEINYGLAVTSLTPAIIVLVSVGGGGPDLVWDRLGGTLLGAALALAGARLLWPTWERRSLTSVLGSGAASERDYLTEVMDGGDHNVVRTAHRAAERARSNAEEAMHRMLREPRSQWVAPGGVHRYCRMLRSLIESTTSLRAALLDSEARGDRPPREPAAVAPSSVAHVHLLEARDQLDTVQAVLEGRPSTATPNPDVTPSSPAVQVVALLSAQISAGADGLRRTTERIVDQL